MEKTNFTKRIAEGGLLVSLAFLFYFIGLSIPVLDILRYISVTPIVIGIMKYGTKHGMEMILATSLLVGILFTPLSGGEFFLTIGLIALTLGTCLKKDLGAFKTIFYTFISAFAGFSLTMLLYVCIMGTEIVTKDFKSFSEWMKSLITSLSSWQLTKGFFNNITVISGLPKNWMDMQWLTGLLVDLIPSLLIFLAFYYVIYLWIFNLFIMKKLNMKLPSNALLSEIPIFLIIPGWTLIFMVIGFISLAFSFYIKTRILEIIGVNLIMIMMIVCFSKGVFSINIFVRNLLPAHRRIRIITGFTITILEFTLFIPLVILCGMLSIAIGVQNVELHEFLGNAYLKNGKFDLAIKHYKKSLELKPDRAISHQMLSVAYQKKGKKDLAVQHFKKAVELGARSR